MTRHRVHPLTDADLDAALADPRNARRWARRVSRCTFVSPTGCLIYGDIPTMHKQWMVLVGDRKLPVGQHRWALMLKLGRPLREQALHTCDHGACISELHLWEGTQLDNMRDASRKGRLSGLAKSERVELFVDLALVHRTHHVCTAFARASAEGAVTR